MENDLFENRFSSKAFAFLLFASAPSTLAYFGFFACCQDMVVLYLSGEFGGCMCEAALVFLKRVPSTLCASKRAMPGVRSGRRAPGRRPGVPWGQFGPPLPRS